MKRFWWGVVSVLYIISSATPAFALSTAPSDPNGTKVNGPLLISGYSFSGHSLKYVQLYNGSSDVVSLDDWRVSLESSATPQTIYATLSGKIAPGKYVTIANATVVPTATFVFTDAIPPTDPVPTSVSILPPSTLNFNNESVSPSITTSTPRVAGAPATFYFARNTSTSTGSYLSTFTAFVPSATFTLASDGLYEAPGDPGVKVVEIYPDSLVCSPFEVTATCNDYVKLRNDSPATIDLTKFRLRTGSHGQSATSTNTTTLTGMVDPGHYVSFPITLNASGSWVWLEDAYGTVTYDHTLVGYPSSSGYDQQSWSLDDVSGEFRWTVYPTPGDQPNKFETPKTVNECAGLRINEIAANVATEDQFVEVVNQTDNDLQVGGCLLQTNRSTTKSFVFEPLVLSTGETMAIYMKDTDLTLTKTTSGTAYILSSDGMTEADAVSYENLAENTSWADGFENGWYQTYAITPGAQNILLEYPACDEGYQRNMDTGYCNKITSESETLADCGEGKYRSVETNRCRNIETTTSTLAPCDSDQYRSPETNRCRNLASTASLLAPCAAGQERNAETNRCRAAASSNELKPCAANQERNPDTNRCRNKTSTSTADFPVEAVAQTGEATMGWWAFGGVGTLAAGYAGWEWRNEIIGFIRRFGSFVKLGR